MKLGFLSAVSVVLGCVVLLPFMSSVLTFLARTFGKSSAAASVRKAMSSNEVSKMTETATFAMG